MAQKQQPVRVAVPRTDQAFEAAHGRGMWLMERQGEETQASFYLFGTKPSTAHKQVKELQEMGLEATLCTT